MISSEPVFWESGRLTNCSLENEGELCKTKESFAPPLKQKAHKHWVLQAFKKNLKNFLRRGRDSNPRYSFPHNSFRDCHNRPLCHLSGGLTRTSTLRTMRIVGRGAKIEILGAFWHLLGDYWRNY